MHVQKSYENLLAIASYNTCSSNCSELSFEGLNFVREAAIFSELTVNTLITCFFREQGLNSDLTGFKMEIADLLSEVESYDVNVTSAEEAVDALSVQANRTQSLYEQLSQLVKSLETRINVNMRQQLTDLLALNQQLATEVSACVMCQ